MKWRKLGVVWRPDGSQWWARTGHAMIPTPVTISDRIIRIYVSCRDDNNRGHVTYVEVAPDDPLRVLRTAPGPVLAPGKKGTFDDNGVLASAVLTLPNGQMYMYYTGFELSIHNRYRMLSSVAISEDGGDTFKRVQQTPLLERGPSEIYFRCAPFVLREQDQFRMWYIGGSEWIVLSGKEMPVYEMRQFGSKDGIHWPDAGEVSLPLTQPDEHGFGRPYVVRDGGRYRLFYSIRKKSLPPYRMGYAESDDGVLWRRDDAALGMEVSPSGWDSEMVLCGAVTNLSGRAYMFYNGNGYGQTGFGLAVREE